MITQEIRGHTLTLTPDITADHRCIWTATLCGKTREFTYGDWLKHGDSWAARVITDAERPIPCRLGCARCTEGCARAASHATDDAYGHICVDCTTRIEVLV
jgi:hypothetical protein